MRLSRRALVQAAAGAVVAGGMAAAQTSWPTRSVSLIVGYPPGGTTDIVARSIAERLTKAFGQTVLVENKAGATGMIAAQLVVKAPPDGHQLLMLAGPNFVDNPPVDTYTAFAPISLLAKGATMFAVPASSPWTSLKQVLDEARAKPGTVNYATSGIGSGQHLFAELVAQQAGVTLNHIPYKGGGQAVTDLVAGQVPFAMLGAAPLVPHVKAGRLRGLAVSTKRRLAALPDVPSIAEAAGIADYDTFQWFALVAPPGTPPPIIERVNRETRAALADPALGQAFAATAIEPAPSGADELGAFLKAQKDGWNEIAKLRGITGGGT
jgi:tripartite-type tricarboxylate transporter receptor subunit TctC